MSIEIIHTAAEGTLVHGTARGDGTNTILKAAGFRWFPSLGVWGIAGSRDRQPNRYKIDRAADALRAAGHEVSVDVDDTHRPTAEAEADRAHRQEERVDALNAKADRKAAEAEAAWEAEHRAVQLLPPDGQPILVGHHSERRHRKAIERAHNATRKAIDATEDAGTAQARAQAAARTTERRYNPVTVKNRLDKLEADQRADQRRLDGHRRVVARTDAHTYVEDTPPAAGSYRLQVQARMRQRGADITYWKGVYAELQAAGVASTHSAETISKGDYIQTHGRFWYRVVRVSAKSVSVEVHDGGWTNTVGYHKISGHRPAGSPQGTDDQ